MSLSVRLKEATRKVPINEGYIGYTLAEPIYNENGKLLLAEGKKLTSNSIFSLRNHKVKHAVIYTKQAF